MISKVEYKEPKAKKVEKKKRKPLKKRLLTVWRFVRAGFHRTFTYTDRFGETHTVPCV